MVNGFHRRNNEQLTVLIEGIRSTIDRNHTTAGGGLATVCAGQQRLAVPVKSYVPHENSSCPAEDRTGVTATILSFQPPFFFLRS